MQRIRRIQSAVRRLIDGRWMCLAFVAFTVSVPVALADEFVPPPKAERDVVATLAKNGGTVRIDADYRVIAVTLGLQSTNEDLKSLATFDRLTQIQIASRNITDEGIEHLKGLKSLTSVLIASSGITSEGLAALRQALPNCRVNATLTADRPLPDRAGTDRPGFAERASTRPTRTNTNPPNPNSSRLATLVGNSAVMDDLKLSDQQRQQIVAAADPSAVARLIDEKVKEALTDEQRLRLKQIELQQAGTSALNRDDIATELKLTDEQRARMRKVADDNAANLRSAITGLNGQRSQGDSVEVIAAGLREKMQEAYKQRDEQVMAVLTDEQRQAWQQLLGPKGPEINNSRSFTTSLSQGATAVSSRGSFARFDTDGNGMLSEEEFPANSFTRQAISRAGIQLKFPLSRDDFDKALSKYTETLRTRP